MTCTVGKTPVKIHGILPVLWGMILFFQGPALLLSTLAALLIHECGHLIMAKIVGARVVEMEITPFGGVIALENEERIAPMRGFLLAAAGPLCSLLGCLLAVHACSAGYLSFFTAQRLAQYNLLLALVNLLPVLPLDGGRMTRHLLCRRLPYAAVTRLLLYLGILTGALLCALSLAFALQGRLNLSPAFAGLYLCYAAALEGRQGLPRYVTSLIARRQKIERNSILPVQILAAGCQTPAQVLLRHLNPGKYHQILVLAPDGTEKMAWIGDGLLCDALLKNPGASLHEIAQSAKSSQTIAKS